MPSEAPRFTTVNAISDERRTILPHKIGAKCYGCLALSVFEVFVFTTSSDILLLT
jgi:hypothetical protein